MQHGQPGRRTFTQLKFAVCTDHDGADLYIADYRPPDEAIAH